MRLIAPLLSLSLVACSGSEPAPPPATDATIESDAITDARRDSERPSDTADATDGGDASDVCCPIGDRGCCMLFGGSRAANPSCGMVCDSIPTDLERRVDDAGCPYWYDPPGGGITCTLLPPDAGSAD